MVWDRWFWIMLFFGVVLIVGVFAPVLWGGPNNKEACDIYVDKFNALPCVDEMGRLNKEIYCPVDLDDGCDITPYYECLSMGHSCEGEGAEVVLNTVGYTDCAEKLICED